jgi:pyruvate formate lyase activating enzyme
MQIGGFIKQSLIDYPGKIAAVAFTQGCNFRCGYCHNPQLVLPELFQNNPEHTSDNILNYLKERKNWLDGVVVTGGEPTIHNDLSDFLGAIKRMGYMIKLDTNGSNPDILKRIIHEKLVDYIAMDIKNVLTTKSYAQVIGIENAEMIIENVRASIHLLKESALEFEFRTTRLPDVHTPLVFEKMHECIGKDVKYIINEFREGRIVGGL